MGARIRAFDWSTHPLGVPASWPQPLRQALGMGLASAFPTVVLWGEAHYCFYNDPYVEILGARHPAAMGAPVHGVWVDAWDALGPVLADVMRTGIASGRRDWPLELRRGGDGPLEERWFSLTVGPIFDPQGAVVGLYSPVFEVTDAVRRRRQVEQDRSRLAELFSMAPTFMAVLEGPEHVYTYANENYQQVFGPRDLIGRPAAEAFPELVAANHLCMPLLDAVYRTGVAVTRRAVPYHLLPPGQEARECVVDFLFQATRDASGVILGTFVHGADVTATVMLERREQLLSELERAAQSASDAAAIATEAARLLAQHLQVQRVVYAQVESDEDSFEIQGAHLAGLPSMARRHRVRDFGAEALRALREDNRPWIVDDVAIDERLTAEERDAYGRVQIRALVCVPLRRGGRLVAVLAVHSGQPRHWNPTEVDLIQGVSNRCAESIERMRIGRQFETSEEQFRTLVQGTSQVHWTVAADGEALDDSPSWRAFTGQSYEEYRGRGWMAVLHPDDRESIGREWTACLATGKPLHSEYRVRRADGAWRWTHVHVLPLRDAGGQVRGWVGMNIDITDRKQAELRDAFLVRLDDRTRNLWEPEDIAFAAMRMLCDELGADRASYLEADVEGRVCTVVRDYAPGAVPMSGEYVVADYGPEFTSAMHRGVPFVANTADAIDLSPEERARFDAIQIGAVIVHPVHRRGRFLAMVAVYQTRARSWTASDVELCRLVVDRCWEAITRARLSRELQEADRRKDEFIATLAHELRNPLAPLRNGLAILTSGRAPDVSERLLTMMERQVDHLVRMVDDLLDVSRITLGKIEIVRERLDLRDAVRNAIETSRPVIDKSEHQLVVSLPGTPVIVLGDAVRMTQVFANLLNNASKYTLPRGRIEIALTIRDGQAHTSVSDNGIGIRAEMRGRVFDIFAQESEGDRRVREGLGIGLAVVKRLLVSHGGTVDVRSDGPGTGSTFTVHLPLAAPQEPGAAPAPATILPLACRRVLIVDDNRDAAESLAILLGTLGANVQVAYEGHVALELARHFRPEVALLDIGMPIMDGHELARRLRALPDGDRLVLVALTGWGQDEDKSQSRAAGFDHHMVKPVDLRQLHELLLREPR
jgi:PAS domain S-box-containing protein|nr:PAS domain-containing protein [Panacagrimonas sp.]